MTNKALYWIAVGVVALGLNSEYHKGNLQLAHHVADRAGAVLCRVTTGVEQTLALALSGSPDVEVATNGLSDRYQAEIDRSLARRQAEVDRTVALRQAQIERVQRKLDRVQMVMNGAELVKVRQLAQVRVRLNNVTSRRMVVVCPGAGKRISINAENDGSEVVIDPQ